MWFDPVESVTAIAINLFTEFLVVIIGVLFVHFIKEKWDERKYGGWKVIVREHGEDVSEVAVSFRKAKEILQIPEALQVFLKGIASPFGWINCNLTTEGRKNGMLQEDRVGKRFIIDFDHNPPPERPTPTPEELMKAIKTLEGTLNAYMTSSEPPEPGQPASGPAARR